MEKGRAQDRWLDGHYCTHAQTHTAASEWAVRCVLIGALENHLPAVDEKHSIELSRSSLLDEVPPHTYSASPTEAAPLLLLQNHL